MHFQVDIVLIDNSDHNALRQEPREFVGPLVLKDIDGSADAGYSLSLLEDIFVGYAVVIVESAVVAGVIDGNAAVGLVAIIREVPEYQVQRIGNQIFELESLLRSCFGEPSLGQAVTLLQDGADTVHILTVPDSGGETVAVAVHQVVEGGLNAGRFGV